MNKETVIKQLKEHYKGPITFRREIPTALYYTVTLLERETNIQVSKTTAAVHEGSWFMCHLQPELVDVTITLTDGNVINTKVNLLNCTYEGVRDVYENNNYISWLTDDPVQVVSIAFPDQVYEFTKNERGLCKHE